LPVPAQPRANGFVLLLRIDGLTAAVPARRARECWSYRQGSRAIAPGERGPPQQTADKVERGGQVIERRRE
jgi:hypothetical protein